MKILVRLDGVLHYLCKQLKRLQKLLQLQHLLTVRSPCPSVVFSSRDDNISSPLKMLQYQVGRMLKGLSPLPGVKRSTYNSEILTSQKRQWARFQMESLIEAAEGFLAVLKSYLDSLCSNLRSHTITNVQSNDDKVSLLLKESFIYSFPYHDRPFMKLFVDTQLFSGHTGLVLSFYQKD